MIDTLRAGASTSILRNGLREIPPRRTVPTVPVPDYPHTFEKELNVAGIYAMAKVNKKYSGPVSGEKSTKHQKRFIEYMFDVKNTVTQFKHSETLRLGHLSAISHLDGEAKE
jgi:cbb3-type cytochrome oxidase cytochrome c subunit